VTEPVDMQATVDRLAAAIGHSLLIEDLDQYPVWWSTVGPVDRTRMRTVLHRHVDPVAAAVIERFKLAEAVGPVRTPTMPGADMWARWCVPIRHDDRLLGFLWVLDPDGTVAEADLPALVECAELAADAMATAQQVVEDRTRRRDELIDRLLEARDPEAARALTRLEGLPSDTRVQVHAPGIAGGWPLPNAMSAHVAGSGPGFALSGAPLPLADLGEAFRRAVATRRAIAAGARVDPASWDGLAAWRLIVDAPESLSPSHIHPGAAVLAQPSNAALTATARVILDHGGDVAAAAKALHLHRTTLYYRMDRIQELTGVDLRTGPARTDLQLALWLVAYRRTTVQS
jgi:PucR C-terminal helix-turn-helix domain